MTEENKLERPSSKGGWLAGGSVFTGVFALIGASCCVLPLILVNLGVSSALIGNLAFFERFQNWFQWLTIALIAVAVFLTFRNGRPNLRVMILLTIGTLIAAAAYFLPAHEGEILRWLNLI